MRGMPAQRCHTRWGSTSSRIFCGCGGCRYRSYLVEPGHGKIGREEVIGGCAMFGAFAGTLVYSVMLFHPEWMSVAVRENSITYDFSFPYRSPIHLPITPAALYALTILVPLLFSSCRLIRIFGVLVVLSSGVGIGRPIVMPTSQSGVSSLPCSRSISST